MKRTLLLITCVLATMTMFAQEETIDYLPFVESNKCWTVVRTNETDHYDEMTFRMSHGESVINGKSYQSLNTFENNKDYGLSFLLREENRKVYMYDTDNNFEFLVFDYSLKEGDTYETYSYDEQKKVTYKVLSVSDYIDGPEVIRYGYDEVADTVTITRRYLRKWTVERTDNEYHTQKTWIEGVGSLEFPLANLYDARAISSRDYLAYVLYQDKNDCYLPFPFYDTMGRVWHGCNLPTGAEDNWEDEYHHKLTYELKGDRLHVYGEVYTQCGPNNYAYFKEEPTDDPRTYKIRFYIQEVEPTMDCMALHQTDFYVPGFSPNMNYIVVDNLGEEHPVINKTPQMAYRPFVEDGKVWTVKVISDWEPLEEWIEYYYFEGDTIINGKTAKRMLGDRMTYGQYTRGAYIGAWYEQDKKVYFAFGGQQQLELLYDFTLSTGDSIPSPNGFDLYIVQKLSGGINGFKGTYYDFGEERWLEGVGSEYYPWLRRNMDEGPVILLSCTVGDEVIYYNSEIDDPYGMGAKKRRFDFTHTTKVQPKVPHRAGEEQENLYGEYNDQLLDIKLNPLDDAYLVRIIDKAGQSVYEKAINAGNIVALNIDISNYPEGQYTVTIENSKETFTGQFDTDTTGIDEIVNGKSLNSKSIYNLQGQRMNSLQKGFNIIEGKKIFVK